MTSECVLDLHANPYTTTQLGLVSSMDRLSLRIDPNLRIKELQSALKHLQSSVNSISCNITSWEEAKVQLGTVMILPVDDIAVADLVQEEGSTDHHQHHHPQSQSHSHANHRDRGLSFKRIKLGLPVKKKKQSKVSMGVLEYVQLLRKSDKQHRWKSSMSDKWSQIRNMTIPSPIVDSRFDDDEAQEEEQVMGEKKKQEQKEVKQTTALASRKVVQKETDAIESVTEKMDKLLHSRIEEAERVARAKELAILKRIDDEIRAREEEEIKRKEDAEKAAKNLLRPLSAEENNRVQEALYGRGPLEEKLATSATDSVQRKSIHTLRPAEWLNDEVIHYFYSMLAKRDEALSAANPGRKRSHFFMSFFFTKLFDEGATNEYKYSNVKRWSKKVPGKDIFALDKVCFACNVLQTHWTCVVIFMQEKRIQFYDSMRGDGYHYSDGLLQYLKDEWAAKKGGELPDADKWTVVGAETGVPRQTNGYDCGVFTCMFADFLSIDRPLSFNQGHIDQCRHRIVLSILKGVAIE